MTFNNLKTCAIVCAISLSVASCGIFSTKTTSDYCLRYELVGLTTEEGNLLPTHKFELVDRNDADYLCLCKKICFSED